MEHNPSRRSFLRKTILTSGALLTPDIVSRAVEGKREEAYPRIEDVPELLQNYVRKFNSWPELVADQKQRIEKFLDSDFFKNTAKEQLRQWFNFFGENFIALDPGAKDKIVENALLELVASRKSELGSLSITYPHPINKGEITEGLYKKGTVSLDTLYAEPYEVKVEDGAMVSSNQATIFGPFHEFWHAFNFDDSMLWGSYAAIIDTLEEKGFVDKEKKDTLLEAVKKMDKGIISKLKLGKVMNNSSYELSPLEIPSFLMELRFAMHIVSEVNNDTEIPKFDMEKSEFTKDHFDFLVKNCDKIFRGFKVERKNEGIEDDIEMSTTFTENKQSSKLRFMNILGSDLVVRLMNKVV